MVSCNSRFQTVRAMEKHLRTHEDSLAPYRCNHPGCDKFYFSFSSLNAHSRCHQHKREELTCQWQNCGRVFDKPCRLKAHMRQHTGDKPYVCNYQVKIEFLKIYIYFRRSYLVEICELLNLKNFVLNINTHLET